MGDFGVASIPALIAAVSNVAAPLIAGEPDKPVQAQVSPPTGNNQNIPMGMAVQAQGQQNQDQAMQALLRIMSQLGNMPMGGQGGGGPALPPQQPNLPIGRQVDPMLYQNLLKMLGGGF
jgi:hypothetical protein